MKIESLMMYQTRELKEIGKFLKDVERGKFKADDRYPQESRLELNEPYTYNIPSTPIWPLIPLYGTTIIKLYPIAEKSKFAKYHGFDIEDIPLLIQLAKDMKKVQFTLADAPTKFEGINFLEQILDEMEPPTTAFIPLDINENDIEDFVSLSNRSRFPGFCEKRFKKLGVEADLSDMGGTYAQLRYLGLHDVADRIRFCITIEKYDEALELISTSRNFLTRPYVDPLKPIFSQLREVAQYGEMLLSELHPRPTKKVEFPYEVGVFLNDKLKLIVPKNVNGAMELSEKYELFDLRKVMKALNDNIKRGEAKAVMDGSREISEIFEEVWHTTDRLKRNMELVERVGIPLGIAVIGHIADSLLKEEYPGLLIELGFDVINSRFGGELSRAASEKITKWTTPNHVVHLYDFRKKYSLSD